MDEQDKRWLNELEGLYSDRKFNGHLLIWIPLLTSIALWILAKPSLWSLSEKITVTVVVLIFMIVGYFKLKGAKSNLEELENLKSRLNSR